MQKWHEKITEFANLAYSCCNFGKRHCKDRTKKRKKQKNCDVENATAHREAYLRTSRWEVAFKNAFLTEKSGKKVMFLFCGMLHRVDHSNAFWSV